MARLLEKLLWKVNKNIKDKEDLNLVLFFVNFKDICDYAWLFALCFNFNRKGNRCSYDWVVSHSNKSHHFNMGWH